MITVAEVVQHTATIALLDPLEVKRGRSRRATRARSAACLIAHDRIGKSFEQVARALNLAFDSCAQKSTHRARLMVARDPAFAMLVRRLERACGLQDIEADGWITVWPEL